MRAQYKADTSIRRTLWRERIALPCGQTFLEKISIKRTFFCTNGVRFIEIPLYLQFMVASALQKNTVSIEEWLAATTFVK